MDAPAAVTVVIPVHNGARWLDGVLDAIRAQHYAAPIEIIVVNDGSTDDSAAILRRRAAVDRLTILDGPRRGATVALNAGIRAATHPLIAQIDQDVVIHPGWMTTLASALDDANVAAAQGHYVAAPDAGTWARVMALDLRQRYDALGPWTNHVCTGNSVYRKSALEEVGLFDESLGYGYDNDVSYRLTRAGYRLAFRADATSVHHWREGLMNYARQQYGFGYGRLDLVAKHRNRIAGDNVSRLTMMLHGPLMAAALALAGAALILAVARLPYSAAAIASALCLAIIAAERLVAGIRAAIAFDDRTGLWFAPAHMVRDVAWAAAILTWTTRRLRGARSRPSDSMQARDAGDDLADRRAP